MLVLHAHLPYVRHPEYNDALEERWLYEAITETYLPLLEIYERLNQEGIHYKVTMSLTPPLANMLADPLLQDRYLHHLELMSELADKEVIRTQYQPEFHRSALHYQKKLKTAYRLFKYKYHKNLILGFKLFQDLGNLEILTCGATHGFLPLMDMYPAAVRGQVLTAVEDYKRHFGRSPSGMWNGECGYYPGLEEILSQGSIRYFYTDTHGLLHASARPKYGVFAPMYTPNHIAYFGRDVETSNSVWSADEGYPGDPNYREFYRDIGFDLDYEYIKPYIHESGLRIATGIKYHKITSKNTPMDQKEAYDPDMAYTRTEAHAENFTFNRERQIENLAPMMDRKPLIVSMYDAELFGHWWYEGPDFIYNLLKSMHHSNIIETINAPEYLDIYPDNQVATPPMSSWGYMGYNEFWLNDTNDWVYRHLHKGCERMTELANKFKLSDDLNIQRACNQAARELLLAQSSDWAFIMRTNTMVEYAKKRTVDHLGRLEKIHRQLLSGKLDLKWLKDIEYRDNIFPEINYRVWSDQEES